MFVRSLAIIIYFSVLLGCGSGDSRQPKRSDAPRTMLWAWERPEDLSFIDTKKVGVAFLAQTLYLQGDDVNFRPRRQPLEVPEDTYLIAVTRIETAKETERRPRFSDDQIDQISDLILNTLERKGVRGVQIDFDVVVSERAFYRDLVKEIRRRLPSGTPLTMTALASWCIGDTWLKVMDVDEAVPMAFVMGADSERVRSYLQKNDWREPLCRESTGLSVDEAPINGIITDRRFYYFKNAAWNAADLERLIK